MIDQFLKLCYLIRNYQNPNAGGCLYMAYAFWKFARKNGDNGNIGIVQYSYGDSDINHNQKYLENGTGKPTSSSHFTWIYCGREYDSCGVFKHYGTRSRKEFWLDDVTLQKFCVEALNQIYLWNNSFDRDQALNALLEGGIDMSDILTE